MIYINKDAEDIYIELKEALDPESNQIGNTYEDYKKGMWVLINENQYKFHLNHLKASIEEVLNEKLIEVSPQPVNQKSEEELLQEAIKNKRVEIFTADSSSNKFFIQKDNNKLEFWLNRDLRNSLLNSTFPALLNKGITHTKLWSETNPPVSIEVPIQWAIEKIPEIEIYAKETYDITKQNLADLFNLKTIEEVNNFQINLNYPKYLIYNL